MASASESVLAPRNKYKLVVLGDEAVGKTSIITRFMYDSFESTYKVTIGIDFVSKNLYLADRVVRLQLWDTAGQERFRSLIPSYIRDSSVAIITFDVTSRPSFASCLVWLADVRKQRGSDALIALVGNKTDLADKRQVSEDEAASLARKEGLLYIETSAKTGANIKQLFQDIAAKLPGGAGAGADASGAAAAAGAAGNAFSTGASGSGAAVAGSGSGGVAKAVTVSLAPSATEQPKPGYCACT